MVFLRRLPNEAGDTAWAAFQAMDIRYGQRDSVLSLAWKLAKDLNRPRAYNTAYLAVALIHGCDLWTADRRFYNAVHATYDQVRWIEEISE